MKNFEDFETYRKEYYRLKNKLGRRPIRKEWLKNVDYSETEFNHIFGGWRKFLEALGEKRSHVTTEELVKNFHRVYHKFGHRPSIKEMNFHGLYSTHYYVKTWGSWRAFLKSQGISIPEKRLTKPQLIENYFRVKKMVGEVPTSRNMREYGKYSVNNYRKHWITWNKFLKSLGESREPSAAQIKNSMFETYHLLRAKLGRIPKFSLELSHKPLSTHYIQKHFGTWGNFLKEAGEIVPKRYASPEQKRQWSIELYFKIKEKLGRGPMAWEYRAMGGNPFYVTIWGSWNEFKKAMGEEVLRQRKPVRKGRRNVTREELMEEYLKLKRMLGRQPLLKDVNRLGGYSAGTYQIHFGSWLNFLKEAGEVLPKRYASPEQKRQWSIERYFEIKEKLGRGPMAREYRSMGGNLFYLTLWGSWNAFKKAMGEEVLR